MKTKILADFWISISVPLSRSDCGPFFFIFCTFSNSQNYEEIIGLWKTCFWYWKSSCEYVPLTISYYLYFLRCQKFEACYITGQWGEFRIKNAILCVYIYFFVFIKFIKFQLQNIQPETGMDDKNCQWNCMLHATKKRHSVTVIRRNIKFLKINKTPQRCQWMFLVFTDPFVKYFKRNNGFLK